MTTLIITRGLPASGKTTWAKTWVANNVGLRARVNKDDLRLMLHNGTFVPRVTEQQIRVAHRALVTALLAAGLDVVCDDTNLSQPAVTRLAAYAATAGASVEVKDFTSVPIDVCIQRDAARAQPVGEPAIQNMYDRYLLGRELPLPLPGVPAATPLTPYSPPARALARRAVLVDIDGTLATMNGRSPYDESRVGEDLPNLPVIHAAQAMYWRGWDLVIMSGRSEACREATALWLKEHLGVPFEGPFLRADGDRRPDWQVKAELFDAHVRHHYRVEFVLDDRTQVVEMWRRLGLTVFQVADGTF
ncbi:AAA family ATPase [Nonomuraea sp. NPDC059023]|uniref:phosphatase domain-containing protein n=1 Tax=unclassified Nonomuraea TaxID=2593643 RepID=UPI00367A182C